MKRQSQRVKKALGPVFKLTLASALIYWLIKTKKITAEPFIQMWATPWLLVFAFGAVLAFIFVNNYRWLLLLQGQRIKTSVKQTLPLTFIGLFFNLAMPGSVGGDVLRAYYIAKEQPGTKVGAATSVLMDRIVGLYAMALIALVAVLTHTDKILSSAQLRPLALFIVCLVLGFTAFFVVGFSESVRSHKLTDKMLEKMPGGKIIERVYDAVHAFRHGKRQFVFGIILSVLVQTWNIVAFYVIGNTLGYQGVTMGALLFLVPLGFIATAVPVSPGGIGVGQAVMLALFNWYGGISEGFGPTLMTIFQVVQAIFGIVGAYFYFVRKEPAANIATAK